MASLDPQLFLAAIQSGACDDYLDVLTDQVYLRRKIVQTGKLAQLTEGTQFYIERIKPKYMTGVLVEVVSIKASEEQIRCKVMYGGSHRWPNGSVIILGPGHVGEIKS